MMLLFIENPTPLEVFGILVLLGTVVIFYSFGMTFEKFPIGNTGKPFKWAPFILGLSCILLGCVFYNWNVPKDDGCKPDHLEQILTALP
jgi:drug/metabolite transporter (DMT)-like permease